MDGNEKMEMLVSEISPPFVIQILKNLKLDILVMHAVIHQRRGYHALFVSEVYS